MFIQFVCKVSFTLSSPQVKLHGLMGVVLEVYMNYQR